MTAKLLYSKPVIDQEILRLRSTCAELSKNLRAPKMAVILVGNNPASMIYVKNKKIFCEKVGADCEIISLDKTISEPEFLNKLNETTNDSSIDGLIVQLPLPKQLQKINLGKLIPANKDLDGFNIENLYRLYSGNNDGVYPCTPKGIVKLLEFYKIPIANQKVTIIGRGILVGKPLFHLMTNLNATVTLCHSKSNIQNYINDSDIIVLAAGCCNLIKKSNFEPRKDCVIIDVGINVVDGKITGDCNCEEIATKVSAITPVPKGIGPMTIWGLVDNLITLAKNNRK